MLETVAIIGPARIGVPLTQAVSAPILGRLHARGVGFWPQLFACATVRLLHIAATTAFFIWVITGGLDAYAGTDHALGRRIGIEVGTAHALALTLAGLLAWAAFASTVQVLVYRRGLRAWLARGTRADRRPSPSRSRSPSAPAGGRFDPRAVAGRRPHCLRSPAFEHRVARADHRDGLARRRLAAARALSRTPVPPAWSSRRCSPPTAFVFALGGDSA